MEANNINIDVEINLQDILEAVANSGDLSEDQRVYEGLAQIEQIKKLFAEAESKIREVEKQVKSAINGRAMAIYGDTWTVIKGDKFKITRVKTGAVYEADDNADDDFLKLKVEVNSRKVDEYIKAHSTLPGGITYNPNRGESLRIALNDSDIR